MKRDLFMSLLKVPATIKGKPVDELRRVQAMNARIFGLGFGVPCGRCGGTGHYSYNPMSGTRCFKCGGAKYEEPNLTRELYDRIEAAVKAGELDKYLAKVRDRQAAEKAAKGAVDAVMKAWQASGVSTAYDWMKAGQGIQPHRAIADQVNKPMCDAYERVSRMAARVDSFTFKLSGGARNSKPLTSEQRDTLEAERAQAQAELIAARDEALAIIAEKAALIPGIIAAHKV